MSALHPFSKETKKSKEEKERKKKLEKEKKEQEEAEERRKKEQRCKEREEERRKKKEESDKLILELDLKNKEIVEQGRLGLEELEKDAERSREEIIGKYQHGKIIL